MNLHTSPLCQQRRALVLGAACAFAAASSNTWAQDYPIRTIKLVVPFPPGGSVDTVARTLAPQLQIQMGQPVVIENRPGANSVLGAQSVKRSAPDGYTLLLNASLQVVNPLIMTTTYDTDKDFTPITYVGALPQLVVVSAQSPYNSLRELLDDASKRPDQLQWATSAYGSAGHLAAELLKSKAQVKMPIVPYKGGGPALNDLIGMHVTAMIEPMASAYPQVKGGRLKALAVTTAKRLPNLPNLPTVDESGFQGFDMPSWYGVWAPAGIPTNIVTRVSNEVRTAIAAPTVANKLASMFFQPVATTPAEFTEFIHREVTVYKELVSSAKIKVED